jgi:hypothetical protein
MRTIRSAFPDVNESTFNVGHGIAYLNIQCGKQLAYQSYVLKL